MKYMKKEVIQKFIKTTLFVLLGNLIYAISVVYFVLPNNLITGGVACIGMIFNKLCGFNLETVITISSYSLFIIGCIFLGKNFAIQTVISSITYPLFISILNSLPIEVNVSPIVAVIIGGVIAGFGLGIVIKQGATTGGTDIPPMIIHKYTKIKISLLMFLTDGIIAFIGLIAYSLESVLLGIIYIYLYSETMNRILVGNTNSAVQCIIIASKVDEISKYIHVDLDRGSTQIKAIGGYTKRDVTLILTVISKSQYDLLEKKVAEVDEKAFIIATSAKDVKGEGFSTYLPS